MRRRQIKSDKAILLHGFSPFDIAYLACLCCLITALVRFVLPNMRDDAYIYLRIASNIAAGHGWAFNPHLAMNAATSPFYAVFLACFTALHLPGADTALACVAVIGFSALGVTIYLASGELGRAGAVLMSLSVCTLPPLLAATGMETPVYLACAALTAFCLQRKSYKGMAFFAGLTALGRPEGFILLPIVSAVSALQHKRLSWQPILIFLATILPWLLFSLAAFHTLMPHTMKVKAIQAGTGYWQQPWFLSFLVQLPYTKWLIFAAGLGAVQAVRKLPEQPFFGVIIAFGAVQVAGYSLLKAPPTYIWYYAPGNLAYTCAVVLGLLAMIAWAGARLSAPPRWTHVPGCVALLACFLYLDAKSLGALPPAYRESVQYMAIGRWIDAHSAPQDWVACDEIGYIGVYSNRNVRDMLGLLEPASIIPLSQHRWEWWFTDDPKPRFVVTHTPGWIGEPGTGKFPWAARAQAAFERDYRQVYAVSDLAVFEYKPE